SDDELQQVRDFLTKIGETTDNVPQLQRMRVVEPLDPDATMRLLERVRANWPAVGDNPLIIRGPADAESPRGPAEKPKSQPVPADREATIERSGSGKVQYAVEERPATGIIA